MFPLSLSDFEYYMLVDDRPSHPMVFVVAAHLEGAFQQTQKYVEMAAKAAGIDLSKK